jgi:chromosome segregation ATPase
LEHQLKEISDQLSLIYEDEQEISSKLKEAKLLRAEKFHQLFKNVSDEIDTLYKTLTF